MLLVYFPLRGRPAFLVILTTIAMGIVLENLALIIWGPLPVSLPSPVHGAPLRFGGVVISMHQLCDLLARCRDPAAAISAADQTRFGILMQATAQDLHRRGSRHPYHRTIAVAFALGAVCPASPAFGGAAVLAERPWAAVSD